jgi:hypothetical protein
MGYECRCVRLVRDRSSSMWKSQGEHARLRRRLRFVTATHAGRPPGVGKYRSVPHQPFGFRLKYSVIGHRWSSRRRAMRLVWEGTYKGAGIAKHTLIATGTARGVGHSWLCTTSLSTVRLIGVELLRAAVSRVAGKILVQGLWHPEMVRAGRAAPAGQGVAAYRTEYLGVRPKPGAGGFAYSAEVAHATGPVHRKGASWR